MAKLHHRLIRRVFSALARRDGPAPPFDARRARRLLVVNTTAVGDTLISTPALRALKKGFDGASLTVLASAAAAAVLGANPYVDSIIVHPGRVNLRYLAAVPGLVRRLRRGRFDLVVVLHGNDPDTGPLVYLTGAPWRLGPAQQEFSFLYTMHMGEKGAHVHEVDWRLDSLGALGIAPDGRGLDLFLTAEDRATARAFLDERGIAPRRFVAVHPFGTRANRWWPEERVVEFCSLLEPELGLVPVIIGGEAERCAAERMAARSGAHCAAGRLRLRASAALLSEAAALVTTDSGPMHMAQAVGTPTVALFGAAGAERTGPVNPDDRIVRRDELPCVPCHRKECRMERLLCMEAIGAREVIDTLTARLRTASGARERAGRGAP
ncbi:MAG TPA: glycosyltransferase family 9 protein [Deltaproteobacteria bacterium]|nr:glycosyltransferase family 9 protein [Deltaproteobacteria bacterium]